MESRHGKSVRQPPWKVCFFPGPHHPAEQGTALALQICSHPVRTSPPLGGKRVVTVVSWTTGRGGERVSGLPGEWGFGQSESEEVNPLLAWGHVLE